MGNCPLPPGWLPISAFEKEIWLAANLAIEQAYLDAHPESRDWILTGRDFISEKNLIQPGGEVKKPEVSVPRSLKDSKFARDVLLKLRGIQNQLWPDIIDFKARAIYEIKTEDVANKKPEDVKYQLRHYYELVEEVRRDYLTTEREWSLANSTWVPPTWMLMPAMNGEIGVCTSATDYKKWLNGLILYDVRAKASSKFKKKKTVAAVNVLAFDDDFVAIMPGDKVLQRIAGEYEPRMPLVAILPKVAHGTFKKQAAEERMNATKGMLEVKPPFLSNTHPIGLLRKVNFAIIGFNVAVWASVGVVGFIIITAELLAAGAAVTTAAGGGGTVTNIAQARAAAAAAKAAAEAAAKQITKLVAGVIAVIGSLEKDAQAAPPNDVRVKDMRPVVIIPIEIFKPRQGIPTFSTKNDVEGDPYTSETLLQAAQQGAFGIGSTVVFDGDQYAVVGQLEVKYNTD